VIFVEAHDARRSCLGPLIELTLEAHHAVAARQPKPRVVLVRIRRVGRPPNGRSRRPPPPQSLKRSIPKRIASRPTVARAFPTVGRALRSCNSFSSRCGLR
jgi:hypothetical protein